MGTRNDQTPRRLAFGMCDTQWLDRNGWHYCRYGPGHELVTLHVCWACAATCEPLRPELFD